jgi:hypothetical protein
MNIRIETQPEIIDLIKCNFVEDGDYTRDVMADEFKELMTKHPDRTLVLVAYDDNKKPVGHIVAYKAFNRSYACLEQAYSSTGFQVPKIGFEALAEWARQSGVKSIRLETERDSVANCAVKRYGFAEHGVVMELKL